MARRQINRSLIESIRQRFRGSAPSSKGVWASLTIGVAVAALAFAAVQSVRTSLTLKNVPAEPAIEAIEKSVFNPNAIRARAEDLARKGETDSAERLLTVSRKLTRRDLQTHAALIELNVQRGRLETVIRLYDEALRGTSGARTLLFPTLADALSDPDIQSALAPIIKERPNWLLDFLYFAGFKTDSSVPTARLIIAAGPLPNDHYYRQFATRFLDQLLNAGQFSEGQRLFGIMPGARSTLLTNVGLAASIGQEHFRPVAWTVRQGDNFETYLHAANAAQSGNAQMTLISTGAARETGAYRFVFLRPGEYGLQISAQTAQMARGSALVWIAECIHIGKAAEIGRLELRAGSSGSRTMMFRVSPKCGAVRLSVGASGGRDGSESRATITNVSLDSDDIRLDHTLSF